MYSAVPSTPPAVVAPSLPKSLAMPKSESFTLPSRAKSRLAGLMSRWTTPRSCACLSAPQTCTAISLTSAHSNRRPRRSSSSRLVPSTELHGIEHHAVLLAPAQQPHDVVVPQLAKRFDLDIEASAKVRVRGQRGGQHLDGRRFARIDIDARVHRAHAAAANLAVDPIWAKLLGLHGGVPGAAAHAQNEHGQDSRSPRRSLCETMAGQAVLTSSQGGMPLLDQS